MTTARQSALALERRPPPRLRRPARAGRAARVRVQLALIALIGLRRPPVR
ncbi:hypothetical protein [Streptomyces sp. fd1-xmd]|nr:hypothetical protein [Streptomyces sp. fd1-xmd]